MLPLLLLTNASAQDAVHPALQAVRGRKVWMVGAPPEDCRRVEEELGLIVDCDTDWETTEDEVVIWCTEIPHEVGPAILDFLGRSHARVRTHQTNPSAAGTGECGMLFEITVRYPNVGDGIPPEIHNSGILGALGGESVEIGGILMDGSSDGLSMGGMGIGGGGLGGLGSVDSGGVVGGKKLFGEGGEFTEPPGATVDYADTLAALRGRKIWMVNAPRSECQRVEQELGLIVECDPSWQALASDEIVIWCTEIPHEAAPALLQFLGKPGYEVRTHQTNPSAAGTGECGQVFEITVRY